MKIEIKKPKIKSVVSPWKLTFGVLAIWVVGVLLGNFINVAISKVVESQQSQNVWLVIVYVVVSIVIGLLLAFTITKYTMRIIKEINININKIAEGDFTARMSPVTKNPQINSAVYNFNEMVRQLNSVAVLKNDFISNFTHEFKTPISSIKGYAELLDGAENLTEEQREYLRIIIEESARLSVLSENTMMLAKLDSQTTVTDKREFSLDGLIEDCVLLFDNQLKERGLDVELDLTPCKIKNDPYLVKEIWINLISNAVKYSRKGGKIYISLKKVQSGYAVSVKDEGVGISEEGQKKLFDKFYQEERSHNGKGIGLGLSIVKRICELIGAEIVCNSKLGEGTTMTVYLK